MQTQKLSSQHTQQIFEVLRSYSKEKDFDNFGLNWSEKKIQESLGHLAWGLFENEKLISFIFMRRVDSDIVELDLMVTRQDMVQKSYMKTLFMAVLEELKSCEIWLEVHENNRSAQDFYLKWGFIRVGERPRYYPGGGKAILMSLKS